MDLERVTNIQRARLGSRTMHLACWFGARFGDIDRCGDFRAEHFVFPLRRLDRLARSTLDLLRTIDLINKVGAGFRSLADAWCDTTTPHGRLMLTVLGGLAEFERSLNLERTTAGRALARQRGTKFGRPNKLSDYQRREALARTARGERQADIARSYRVSPALICVLAKVSIGSYGACSQTRDVGFRGESRLEVLTASLSANDPNADPRRGAVQCSAITHGQLVYNGGLSCYSATSILAIAIKLRASENHEGRHLPHCT